VLLWGKALKLSRLWKKGHFWAKGRKKTKKTEETKNYKIEAGLGCRKPEPQNAWTTPESISNFEPLLRCEVGQDDIIRSSFERQFRGAAHATNASMLDLDLPIKYAYAFRIGHAELPNPHEFGIF
jgi:hypothetical protein